MNLSSNKNHEEQWRTAQRKLGWCALPEIKSQSNFPGRGVERDEVQPRSLIETVLVPIQGIWNSQGS